MAGFPEVFVNMTPIVVMFLAWAVVILCFFVLAIQLFITLIEFKLTTLAGFVLVPFALWNKTSFLAEKVLGNVVSSGIKVLVLAVIVGIGSGLFAEFRASGRAVHRPCGGHHAGLAHAAGVGDLRAGHCHWAGLRRTAAGCRGDGRCCDWCSRRGGGSGAAATGVGGAVMAGARRHRLPPSSPELARGRDLAAGSAKSAFRAGSAAVGGGAKGAMAGLGNVAKGGAQAAGQRAGAGIKAAAAKAAVPFKAGWQGSGADGGSGGGTAGSAARRCHWQQDQRAEAGTTRLGQAPATPPTTHPATTTAAHTLRGGDGGGSGQGPSLRDSDS